MPGPREYVKHAVPIAIIMLLLLGGCQLTVNEDGPAPVDSFWDYRDPKASEAAFRDLVASAEDDHYRVEAMTQLARSLGMQRDFKGAQSVLDEAAAMVQQDMVLARVRLQLEQGRVLNSSGSALDSVPFFERALETASSTGLDFYAIDAAHMLGIVTEPEQAIDWNERAMVMAEQTSDERAKGWLGPLYNNLAWTYSDLGQHEQALAIFEKDALFRESRDLAFEASIARWSAAKMLRLLGRVEESLERQNALLDHPLRQGNPAEGYTNEEIGECLLLLGRAEEARSHFATAYDRLSPDEWLQANEPERLARLKDLAGR